MKGGHQMALCPRLPPPTNPPITSHQRHDSVHPDLTSAVFLLSVHSPTYRHPLSPAGYLIVLPSLWVHNNGRTNRLTTPGRCRVTGRPSGSYPGSVSRGCRPIALTSSSTIADVHLPSLARSYTLCHQSDVHFLPF